MASPTVTLSDVEDAVKRIKPYANRTPVLTSQTLNKMSGTELYLKCENFQKGGAFKFRGACNAVLKLTDEEAAKGVVTHSSGNHAQALALAAKLRGINAYVVMPKNAPESKIKAVQEYGATITLSEPTSQSREEICKKVQERHGATYVAPFDNLSVIAGQGTAALELLQEVPNLDAIIAPVSGGGLLSGICVAAKAIKPSIHVFGAEPTGADDAYRSLITGERLPQLNPQTFCDGLRTGLGVHTWPLIKKHCTAVLTATDPEIRDAMFLLWERMKIVVEPSGSVGLAVVMNGNLKKQYPHVKKVGIILSGGNMDLKDWDWSAKL